MSSKVGTFERSLKYALYSEPISLGNGLVWLDLIIPEYTVLFHEYIPNFRHS